MPERTLSLHEIRSIPDNLYPMMVFSDNVRGLFALGVKVRTKGCYGHFMWLIGPDELASQWFTFRRFPVSHYSGCLLKLVHNPAWTGIERQIIIRRLREELGKPWWKTRYDILAIVGQLSGLKWLQTPWLKICSDYIGVLKLVDPEYDLKHPSPADANAYTKRHNPPYEVYGRYFPD